MANGRATGPDEIPAAFLKFELVGEPLEISLHSHSTIAAVWTSGQVPQEWQDTIKMLHKRDGTEGGNYGGISLVTHAVRVLL